MTITRKISTYQFVFKNENYLKLIQEIVEYFLQERNKADGTDYTQLMEDTTIVFDNASQAYIATVYCLREV